MTLRLMLTGRVGSTTSPPIVTVQAAPSARGAHEARALELDAHHRDVALAARACALDAAGGLALQLAEIDRGIGVEDQPESIAAVENRGRGRAGEPETSGSGCRPAASA